MRGKRACPVNPQDFTGNCGLTKFLLRAEINNRTHAYFECVAYLFNLNLYTIIHASTTSRIP
jgi:hypothetical protein